MQKIYSVIHAESASQILRNVQRTIDAGANGTFVINHAGISLDDMGKVVKELSTSVPADFLLGINPLGMHEPDTFDFAQECGAQALWLDESFIRKPLSRFKIQLDEMDEARKRFKGQYFGSVAFKTQGPCDDPKYVALAAINHVDVVTTSGPGTGYAPDVQKIKTMKDAIGDKPLAIASGMSPENIHLFPGADAILVASGVQDSWTELSTDRLRLMVERKAK